MGKLFRFLYPIFHTFACVKKTVYAEPIGDEPCVFLANHIGAMGPIYMAVTFPHRENAMIWCNEGVMKEDMIVDYVRHDWWWNPESRLAPLYSATLPYIAAAIVPKVMRSGPSIAVRRDARIMTTMRESMTAMKEGKHIVIFPERPDGYNSHAEHLQMGWLNLCTLYRRQFGREIKMVPVYIDRADKTFYVGKAITADADVPLPEQEARIEGYLASWIRGEGVKGAKTA